MINLQQHIERKYASALELLLAKVDYMSYEITRAMSNSEAINNVELETVARIDATVSKAFEILEADIQAAIERAASRIYELD